MAQIFAAEQFCSKVFRQQKNGEHKVQPSQGPPRTFKKTIKTTVVFFFSLEHEKNHTKRSQKLCKTSCSAGLSDVFLLFQPLFMVLSGMGIIFERPPSQELSRRFRKPGHTAPLSTSSTTGTQQLRKFERWHVDCR